MHEDITHLLNDSQVVLRVNMTNSIFQDKALQIKVQLTF